MYDEPLIHWGVPGMKWGVRRMRSSSSSKNPSKQSHFSRSLQQKYGHSSVSSLVNSIKPAAKKAATVAIQVYVGYKIGQLIGNVTYNLLTK